MTDFLIFLKQNYMQIVLILVGLYEVIIRYYPTVANYSIIALVIEVLQFLIPNLTKNSKSLAKNRTILGFKKTFKN
jgi:uncharacterized membrane protein (Fun14 family)